MQNANLMAILPALVILGTGLGVVLYDLFARSERAKGAIEWIAYLGIGTAFGLLFWRLNADPVRVFSDALTVDKLSRFASFAVLSPALLTIVLSVDYIRARGVPLAEYIALVLISTSGMMFLSMASDLISMFLCIEIMSIAIYVLCGITRRDPRSNEAAIKYFVQGAFATAFLLYGMALTYGATGTIFLHEMTDALDPRMGGGMSPLAMTGLGLMVVGFAFKLGAAPFHLWVPDVYEGAPTAVTAFMSVAVKTAGLAAFVRLLYVGLGPAFESWSLVLAGLAALTMLAGNLGAVMQTSVKRMLAYSSVAHVGYALVGLAASLHASGSKRVFFDETAGASSLLYLFFYTFMTLGAFAFLIYVGRGPGAGVPHGRDAEDFEDLAGLAKRRPWAAFFMTIFMVSLAGIPPTAGFFGKFVLFKAAVDSGLVWLAVLGVLTSVVGLAYYLRVVVVMYMRDPAEAPGEAGEPAKADFNAWVVVAIAAVLTVAFGLRPSDYLAIATQAVVELVR